MQEPVAADSVAIGTVRAMACDVTVHVPGDAVPDGTDEATKAALRVFRAVHRACTRFDPDSPLMRANAAPDRWHDVPVLLFDAVREAHGAYLRTRGRFDPRVLADLERLGYDRSHGFERGPVATTGTTVIPADVARRTRGRWRPRFRFGTRLGLHLGGERVDLGGIGKGLALRWAGERLATTSPSYLLDAGGDCLCRGPGGGGDGWQVGVEHPASTGPAAVLRLRDRAVATSSTRLRRWTADDVPAHHLIDPRTGLPGGDGLVAVTVVSDDPARAEVLTKALFLSGAAAIADEARRRSAAALWIDSDGSVSTSGRMDRYVVWRVA